MLKRMLVCLSLSALLIWLIPVSPLYAASGFTISGTLQTTSPKDNPYQANYKLVTPSNHVYYLKLTKDNYKKWVGQDTYFHVVGQPAKFAVYSSGQGTRNNTAPTELPKTGTPLAMLFCLSLLGATGYLFWSHRKNRLSLSCQNI